MTKIVGIDTDVNGAISYADYDKKIFEFHNVPNMFEGPKDKRIVDPAATFKILLDLNTRFSPDIWAIEAQNSRPGQSSVATFSFGRTYGVFFSLVSVLADSRNDVKLVRPSAWKQAFRLSSVKNLSTKLANEELARQGYKGKPPKISAAEAFLIGRYALAKYVTKEIR